MHFQKCSLSLVHIKLYFLFLLRSLFAADLINQYIRIGFGNKFSGTQMCFSLKNFLGFFKVINRTFRFKTLHSFLYPLDLAFMCALTSRKRYKPSLYSTRSLSPTFSKKSVYVLRPATKEKKRCKTRFYISFMSFFRIKNL